MANYILRAPKLFKVPTKGRFHLVGKLNMELQPILGNYRHVKLSFIGGTNQFLISNPEYGYSKNTLFWMNYSSTKFPYFCLYADKIRNPTKFSIELFTDHHILSGSKTEPSEYLYLQQKYVLVNNNFLLNDDISLLVLCQEVYFLSVMTLANVISN